MTNHILKATLDNFSLDQELYISVNADSSFSYLSISQHTPSNGEVLCSIKMADFLRAIKVSKNTFKRSVIKSLINSLEKEVNTKKNDHEKAIHALRELENERAA